MASLRMPEGPRRLGRTELAVGPLAYGCWRLAGTGVAAAREKIETALEAGMSLVDTADIYGGDGAAETLLGRVLAEAPGLRARMVLATKGGIRPGAPYDSSGAWLREACEASLRRLGVDSVDLYQIHRPDLLERMDAVATEQGVARSAVALAFVGLHPSGAIPIVGTQRPERIRAAAAALRVELDRSTWYGLLEAAQGERMP